jgi:Family of unknown function (DUF6527)
MIRHRVLDHEFVQFIPENLSPGRLYISMDFGMAVHSCACGCGAEVTTPLGPTDWFMVYDGDTVSLHPSIGNWNLPCRSHYVIRRGRVITAPSWTREQIAAERERDAKAKADYYGVPVPTSIPAPSSSEPRWRWQRWWRWLTGRS